MECRQSWSFQSPVETSSISTKGISFNKKASYIQYNYQNQSGIPYLGHHDLVRIKLPAFPFAQRSLIFLQKLLRLSTSKKTIWFKVKETCCTADPGSKCTSVLTPWVNLPQSRKFLFHCPRFPPQTLDQFLPLVHRLLQPLQLLRWQRLWPHLCLLTVLFFIVIFLTCFLLWTEGEEQCV